MRISCDIDRIMVSHHISPKTLAPLKQASCARLASCEAKEMQLQDPSKTRVVVKLFDYICPKNNFLQKIWFEICMIHFLCASNMCFFVINDGDFGMVAWFLCLDGTIKIAWMLAAVSWRNLNIFQEVWNLLISMGRYLDICQERWLYNYTLQRKQTFLPLPKIKYLTQLRVAIENLQNGHVVFLDSKESKSCDLHRSLVTSTSFASMASLKLGKLENTCKTVSCDPRSGES